ncbi:MAG: hypothetical protein ACRD34_02650, partial [Bryobacteraceae bacterium]
GKIPFAFLSLLALSVQCCLAASNGLSLSAALDHLSPHKDLRVQLKNMSATALDVYVGAIEGIKEYNFRFTATAPNGKQHELFNLNGKQVVAGLLVPIVIRLAPGASRTFVFHLHDLGYFRTGGPVRLGTLLQKGDSIQVSFRVRQRDLETAQMGGLHSPVHLWTGRVRSSQIHF